MRTLTAGAAAALASGRVALALLVRIGTTPPVLLNTTPLGLQVGSDLYLGAASLGSVDVVAERPGAGQALQFTLSPLPTENLSLALQEDTRGKSVLLQLAVLDADTFAVLDTPACWSGVIDQMSITFEGATGTITVAAVHRGETFRRPKPLRYTDGDQRRLYPGDTSLRYVLSQAQVQDVWPAGGFFRQ